MIRLDLPCQSEVELSCPELASSLVTPAAGLQAHYVDVFGKTIKFQIVFGIT